ncbi:hypothetical protein FKW77_002729 [Venturia effusa]|uniref:Asp/Glu/hydantoin racemase n=1 Tax=Venturia effusa TaxID=50376 RepID=A0A517LNJ1_9PEZI|nr:hypothetical protein FKW77_002729 [Venturia effusa]
MAPPTKKKILIINPNSTVSMTNSLKPLVDTLGFTETIYTYFTAPTSSPPSINNDHDAASSATHCLPALQKSQLLPSHDAFLVACYSQHPLVTLLKQDPHIAAQRKSVTGIFEASVATCLQLLLPGERFGIVSTGKVWETILTEAVASLLGTVSSTTGAGTRFAGVQTTGLDATELHDTPVEEVRRRMKEATRRLVSRGDVGAVCLGCAGMVGMEEMVREACVEELGEERGGRVRVVDGVKAGVAWLEGAVRAEY